MELIKPTRINGIKNMDKRQKILIVNDSELNRDILKEILGETYNYLEAKVHEQREGDFEYVHLKTGEKRWFHNIAMGSEVNGKKKYILVMSDRTADWKMNQALSEAVRAAETEDTSFPAAGSDFRGKCILLVEDNELNSEITVEILNGYGCQVDTAENGAEAVEKIKNSKPGNYNLVLMDVQMPVMNGYEATKQIRALNDPVLAGITIIAMTANAFDEDRRKALECGMDGFLTKPIVIEELMDILQKNLD